MSFVDDLSWANDEDEITASGNPGWTLETDGVGKVYVETSSVTDPAYKARAAGGGSGYTAYVCTDQGSDDHETIGRIKQFEANGRYRFVARYVDQDNWWGFYLGGTGSAGLRLSKNISGSTSDVISTQGEDEQWVKVKADGSDITFELGGTSATPSWSQQGSTQSDSNTNTRQGIVCDGLDTDAPWGYFEAAALGGGGTTVTADTGSFTLTGNAATLTVGRKLAADAQSYTLTGQDAALKRGFVALAEAGTITLTGQAAALIAARKIAAAQATYTYTGNDAGLTYTPAGSYDLVADAASYTLTGIAATLAVDRLIGAQTAAYTLTGVDAGLTYTPAGATTMTAEAAAFTLTGQASALLYARILPATVQTYAVTGQDVALRRGYSLALDAGAYSLSGLDVDWARTYQVAAGVGAYTLTGRNVTLDYSAAEVLDPGYCAPVVRAARYASIVRADRHAPIIRR